MSVVNLYDIEAIAAKAIQAEHFDYYRSGAQDEITLQLNNSHFNEIRLRPKMLRDVSVVDTKTTLLGSNIAMPLVIAPTAFQCLAHADGERATAVAASRAGTIMTLSTLSTSSIEEVAQAAVPHRLWFQLYVYRDRKITEDLIKRAEASGYKALVLTVDSPKLGKRERDIRNNFHLPPGLSVKNLEKFLLQTLDASPDTVQNNLAHYIATLYDQSLTWQDLEWIVSMTKLPVLVKGILRGDDAILALKSGANGIIVSNHGARQLDTALSGIEALPEIVQAVRTFEGVDVSDSRAFVAANQDDSKALVMMDGGVRRGADIYKALCLGARAVLLGRPVLWGLAMDGANGVEAVLKILYDELVLTMQLSGAASLSDLTRDCVKSPF